MGIRTDESGQGIADAFGLGPIRSIQYAAEGMMARIWRLETASGSYAVKEFDGADRYELSTKLEYSAGLADAAARAGVLAPRTFRSRAGGLVHRLAGDAPIFVSVSTWIDGRPCDVRRDAADAAPWLGETVAILERLPDPAGAPALDPWLQRLLTTVPADTQWRTALEQARRRERPWASFFASRMDQFIELGSTVPGPDDGDATFLHTDLQPKNVLVTPAGFALLDWDDAGLCSRKRMLARILTEWLTRGGVDEGAIADFMRAYRSRGGSAEIRDLGDFGYAVAAFLNYAYETIAADLREPGQHSIAALLTNVLDIRTLQSVLDVVHDA